MYPVSASYKTAILQNARTVSISGTITLIDDTTIDFDNSDILVGSVYFESQCVSEQKGIEIGNAIANELRFGLISPDVDPYSLDRARVNINFGLVIDVVDGVPVWEYVPLGIFYIISVSRATNSVNVTCVDGMILLDNPYNLVTTRGIPASIIAECCLNCGISFNADSIATFANSSMIVSIPSSDKIKTYRDIISWLCQLLACFARIDRLGVLELVQLHGTPVASIEKEHRFSPTTCSDFSIKVVGISMEVDNVAYVLGSSGTTLELDENPFLIGKDTSDVSAALTNILSDVSLAEYTPYSISYIGDPSLDAGDYVTVKNSSSLVGDFDSIITHSSWQFRGTHTLQAIGQSEIVAPSYSQQEKAISTIKNLAAAAKMLATASSQTSEMISKAIGGNILIRQDIGTTNEILIMDSNNHETAVKIWRWNIGGFGYSDNCVGADNPDRVYTLAIGMDGSIDASFIKTGTLSAGIVFAGELTGASGTFLSLTAGVAGGRRLHMGQSENEDPFIRIYNDSDAIVLELDRLGITFENGSKIQPYTTGTVTMIGFFMR